MQKGKEYIGVGGGCLILNNKKEVLLIRRAGEVRNEAGWWSKPGGGVKFGETAEKAIKISWFAMDNLPEKITQTTAEPIKNYLEGRFLEF